VSYGTEFLSFHRFVQIIMSLSSYIWLYILFVCAVFVCYCDHIAAAMWCYLYQLWRDK